jgi:hypothetical protein
MYEISELRRVRPAAMACTIQPRLFFALYYRVEDDAFRHAARTWLDDMKQQEGYSLADDELFLEITTEKDFRFAWCMVSARASEGGTKVMAGAIFSHATLQSDGRDGLELGANLDHDGTLKRDEIPCLPVLPWAKDGYLVLTGCNTGNAQARDWSPAELFARHQRVMTLGQTGFSTFSKSWCTHRRNWLPAREHIALWAYRRTDNDEEGDGARMEGAIFRPQP